MPPEKWLSAPGARAKLPVKQMLFAAYIYGLIVCALIGGLSGSAQRNTPYGAAILCTVFMVVNNSWYHKRGLKRIKR
jgi:ABC-type Mn2+/Zn2+ transport system permease subunit